MAETTLPDAEGAVRTYLRADAAVAAVFSTRVFFGVDTPSAYPVAVVQRIGGGLGGTEEGLQDIALLQVDVWGDVHDKASAFAGMQRVIEALHAAANYTGHSGTILYGCNVQSWAFLPDDGERARYSVTFQAFVGPN